MRYFKTSLLLVYCFLLPIGGNAELIGGHDRQRLALIFLDKIEKYLQRHPLTINTEQFPALISDLPEDIHKKLIFDVLVEEGDLSLTLEVGQPDDSTNLTTQQRRYLLVTDGAVILIGRVAPSRIAEMTKIHVDSEVDQYQVTFNWTLSEPAEWIWAPSLSRVPHIVSLRNSISTEVSGTAVFKWDDQRWTLIELNHFPETQK